MRSVRSGFTISRRGIDKPMLKFSNIGFTLIEILVVVSIIGVLISVSVVSFRNAQVKARDTVRKSDLNNLSLALEGYLQKNGSYVDGLGTTCTGLANDTDNFYSVSGIAPYISGSVPVDPSTGLKYCYLSINHGASYRLFAKLEDCQDSAIINPATCPIDSYNYSRVSIDLNISPAP
jgi:prepilin-type N-terminal cleavage/methylation domain-containing protein